MLSVLLTSDVLHTIIEVCIRVAGLLDESVGIRSTACRLPASIFRTDEQKQQGTVVDAQELKKILLSSADALYAEVSNSNSLRDAKHLREASSNATDF